MIKLITILLLLSIKSYSQFYPSKCGDVTFTDSDFQFSIPGYQVANFTARSTAAYVELVTSETNLTVKIAGNWAGHTTQSDCEVMVNGVYNQSIRLIADSVIESHQITLPPGEKTVRLVNGYTVDPSGVSLTLPKNGVYIQGVTTDSCFKISIPQPIVHKWVFVGNSITTGLTANHAAVTGFLGLFRNDGRSIQSDAFGARRLLTNTSANAHTMAAFVSQEMNGTASNELFVMLGTNNFASFSGQSKITFKSEYQFFLDSMHAQRPDIIIYCISPFIRNNYSTPNSQGATCEDFADAIRELLTTRTWAKFIYGKDLGSLANLVDGLHFNQTGHQEIHDKFLIQYNILQCTCQQ